MHHQQAAQPVAPCGDADVYIYLLCHADRRTNRCHPSEATMAKAKELMESGRTNRKSGHGNLGLSSATVRSLHLMLHNASNRAVKERLILRNPTDATLALQNGVDVKTVSSMLGHYDAGFTLRTYTHATRQKQDEAAQTMGSFMAQVM